MPTKKELEQEVADLKAQLADKPAGPKLDGANNEPLGKPPEELDRARCKRNGTKYVGDL